MIVLEPARTAMFSAPNADSNLQRGLLAYTFGTPSSGNEESDFFSQFCTRTYFWVQFVLEYVDCFFFDTLFRDNTCTFFLFFLIFLILFYLGDW